MCEMSMWEIEDFRELRPVCGQATPGQPASLAIRASQRCWRKRPAERMLVAAKTRQDAWNSEGRCLWTTKFL